jgi:hypothetical protein
MVGSLPQVVQNEARPKGAAQELDVEQVPRQRVVAGKRVLLRTQECAVSLHASVVSVASLTHASLRVAVTHPESDLVRVRCAVNALGIEEVLQVLAQEVHAILQGGGHASCSRAPTMLANATPASRQSGCQVCPQVDSAYLDERIGFHRLGLQFLGRGRGVACLLPLTHWTSFCQLLLYCRWYEVVV